MPFLRPGSRVLLPAAIASAVCASLLAAPAAGALSTSPQISTDDVVAGPFRADSPAAQSSERFIVKFREDTNAPGARGNAYGRVAQELGIAVKELRTMAGGAMVVEAAGEVPARGADDVVAVLNAHPDVEYAEVDVLLQPAKVPTDPGYPLMWNLSDEQAGLRMPQAWDRTTGTGQTIAVIDSGITGHRDLAANVLPGYDFISEPSIARDGNGRDSNPRDEGDACTSADSSSWHGTHVAGTAAAVGNNGVGVVGVAYGAKILPVRALGACGGYMSDVADAVIWAAGGDLIYPPVNSHPAKVINMSLGASAACGTAFQRAIDFAVGQGSVVVAAAGNESQAAANVSPANCQNVVVVGATDRGGNKASYSNYGPEVDISAPGGDGQDNILSTSNTGTMVPEEDAYEYMRGTSMAAPHVAGVAALILSLEPTLTPAAVEQILKETARPLPGACTGGCGAGIVDATAAVNPAQSEPVPLPEPAPSDRSIRSVSDVIAADSNGTLWNYPSNGEGGFLPRVKIGSGWSSLKNGFVTDWNRDGVLDLIAQWKDGRLMHYPGRNEGGFSPAQQIGSGWDSYQVTVGEWRSGDKHPGIVAYDSNGTLWFYPNSSGGALSTRTQIGAGWLGLHMTMTDFDGDSRMDILAKRSDGALLQYRSNGSGSFISEGRPTIGTGWGIIDSITNLPGYKGIGQQGLMTRLTDGRLAYYPFADGRWGARSFVGAGWSAYNIFG